MEGARLAEPGDGPRIRELWRAARAELAPMRGGDVFLRREARGDVALAPGPDRPVWVGTIDGEVIGYAAVYIDELDDGFRLGVIDELFVEEGARAVGVGEAMMGEMLAWCRTRGCTGVDAAALPGHRATKNFFE